MLLDAGYYQTCFQRGIDELIEPLIDELEELWRGVVVVDISRPPSSRHFDLKAVLMWIMHDFPGYSDCSSKNSLL